jgi:hypothetical protein
MRSACASNTTMRLLGGLLALALLGAAACGGKAFFDPFGNGGGGEGGAGGDGGAAVTVTSGGGQPPVSVTSVTTATVGTTSTGGSPAGEALVEVPFGTVNAGQAIAVSVAANVLGFAVFVEGPTPESRMGVASLAAPDGTPVIGNYQIGTTAWVYAWYGITVAAVPQSDLPQAMPNVQTGDWQVVTGDPTNVDQSAEVTAWLRTTSDGAFHGGKLDVNVLHAGGFGQAYVDAVLGQAFGSYAGLTLGSVQHIDIDKKFGVIDESNVFQALETTQKAMQAPALNLIVVDSFTGSQFEQAGGLAAGIPGQGIRHGSHASGILVLHTGDSALDALILRHETGHLSGLFHTTEFDGVYTDTLGDTASCPSIQQDPFGCPDTKNIMFPAAANPNASLSPLQQRVIQGGTLWRAPIVTTKLGSGIDLPAADAAPAYAPAPPPVATATLSAAAARAAPRAWAAALPAAAATLLAAHWCVTPALRGGARVDHGALVMRLGATRAGLLAVGDDAGAPAYVRGRALATAGREKPTAAEIEVLAALAADAGEARLARIGAWQGLGHAGTRAAVRRAAVRSALAHDADPVLRRIASR